MCAYIQQTHTHIRYIYTHAYKRFVDDAARNSHSFHKKRVSTHLPIDNRTLVMVQKQ